MGHRKLRNGIPSGDPDGHKRIIREKERRQKEKKN